LHRLRNKILRTTGVFQGAYRFAVCIWLPNFHTYMIM
jgi:hypothetical protein